MERLYSQTLGAEVVTGHGETVARVIEVLIEPETAKIAGFLLTPTGKEVLLPYDIVQWNRHVVVNDPEEILGIEDIVKVRQIYEQRISLFRNKVFTQSGLYLGRVIDFAMNSQLFMVTKLVIAKTFLGILAYDEKIIARKNIVEIKRDGIVVKDIDATVPIQEAEMISESPLSVDATLS